jgi:hypothetical protein
MRSTGTATAALSEVKYICIIEKYEATWADKTWFRAGEISTANVK